MQTRSSFRIITILTLISLLVSFSAYADIHIFFPVKDKSKSVSNMHIVGMSDSKDDFTIRINGNSVTKKLIPTKDKDGKLVYMLMAILKLDDGENKIVITQGTESKEFNITKVDSPSIIDDWTEQLSTFHSSVDKQICLNCHKFENIGDCVNCHRDKFAGQWVHSPVRKGECFKCHDKDNNFTLQDPIGGVCLSCHVQKKEAMDKAEFKHEPAEDGYCTICHSPHKSNVKTHLRKPVNELCSQCHELNDPATKIHATSYMKNHPVEGVYAEKIKKNIDCGDCHNLHYADNDKMVDTPGGAEKICVKCHEPEEASDLLQVLKDEQTESTTEETK